jgi:hypothetical protein
MEASRTNTLAFELIAKNGKWIAVCHVPSKKGGQVGYMPSFKSGRSTSRRSIGPRSGALMARTFYL